MRKFYKDGIFKVKVTNETKSGKDKCWCGDYKAYGDTLSGICAPMMPMDECINCVSTQPTATVKLNRSADIPTIRGWLALPEVVLASYSPSRVRYDLTNVQDHISTYFVKEAMKQVRAKRSSINEPVWTKIELVDTGCVNVPEGTFYMEDGKMKYNAELVKEKGFQHYNEFTLEFTHASGSKEYEEQRWDEALKKIAEIEREDR